MAVNAVTMDHSITKRDVAINKTGRRPRWSVKRAPIVDITKEMALSMAL